MQLVSSGTRSSYPLLPVQAVSTRLTVDPNRVLLTADADSTSQPDSYSVQTQAEV